MTKRDGLGALRVIFAWLAFICLADEACALDASIPLSLLDRTAFRGREGAPGGIQAVAQTSDGFLWLGTPTGLYQFDGVAFRRYQPPGLDHLPDSNISALAAAPGGGLWAGTRFGRAYFISPKSIRIYGSADGLPAHTLDGVAADSQGHVWLASSFGVFRLSGDHWLAIRNIDGMASTASGLDCIKVDGHGNLWIYDLKHVFVLRPTSDRMTVARDSHEAQGIFLDAHGEAWIADATGLHSLSDVSLGIPASDLPGYKENGDAHSGVYFVDSADMAWGLTPAGDGFRVPLPRATSNVPSPRPAGFHDVSRERLAHIDVAIRPYWLEDTEGNVWITSSSGLDRLRSTKVHRAVADGLPVGSAGIAVSRAGTLWVQSGVGLYRRPAGHGFTKLNLRGSSLCSNCSIFAARDESLYRGRQGFFERIASRGFEPVAQPVEQTGRKSYHAISEDGDGKLWVSVAFGRGVFKMQDGKWARLDGSHGIPAGPALSMTPDRDRMWLGYPQGKLALVQHDVARLLDEKNGLAIGDVLTVAAQGEGAWLGGTSGLAYFDGNGVHPVNVRRLPLTAVSGLLLTPEGDLWLNGEGGIQRIPKKELDAFVKDTKRPLAADLFDIHAGVEGAPAQFEPIPTAARTPDGLLWFSTSFGLYWIDPRHVGGNPVAPKVVVLGVRANGVLSSGESITLAPGSSALEIRYTAPILGVPELAQFKYRLDGVDAEWQDAGDRRSAFYTNLQPGSYRFQVMAANEDGVWSERSAEVVIDIVPAYWQTTWFKAGAIASAALLVVFAAILWYRIRVRLLARAMRLEAEIQQAERERIARDLHDTLLQNMYGLVWRMDVISRRFPTGDQNRTEMGEALDRAEKALGAGRERMFAPQDAESPMGPPLGERLSALGRTWSTDTGHDFQVDIRDERPLRPEVVLLLERILSEAVVNAFRHSGATSVELSLHFDSDHLRCSVLDNGVGVPLEFLEQPPDGHLGLRLMRDRAVSIGASLRICRRDAGGTTVELLLPSRMAYARAPLWRRVLSKVFDRGSFSSSGASPRVPSHSTTKPTALTIAPKNIALRKP